MKSLPARAAVPGHMAVLGEMALRVPVAGRVIGQLVNPTTPVWRRVMLVVVLAESVLGALEVLQVGPGASSST